MARHYRIVQKVDSTFTELPNVLTMSVDVGRTALLNTIQPATATFTYRRLSGSTPIPDLGTKVYIVDYTTGSTAQQIAQDNNLIYVGYVQDASIDYGIDDAADAITVRCESYLSVLGRNVLNDVTFSHDDLVTYIDDIETASGATIDLFNAGASEEIHTVDWSGSVADLLRLVSNTVYGRIVELDDRCALLAKNYTQSAAWKFTDAGSGTYQEYSEIRYESLADNYFTKIQVQYPTNQVEVAGTGNRVLTIDTLSRNAGNAASLATYYKNTYGFPVMGLAQVSALASRQSTFRMSKLADLSTYQDGIYNCVGTQLEVDFRGQVITTIVEGVSVSATPADSRYTFYLSPADLNSYLVLDNTVLGRLDFNKLGF